MVFVYYYQLAQQPQEMSIIIILRMIMKQKEAKYLVLPTSFSCSFPISPVSELVIKAHPQEGIRY